jgi:hypothetical protein
MVMIDSDIIIWILRGKKEIKNQFEKVVSSPDNFIFITPIQIVEIYAGLRRRERVMTEIFLNSFKKIKIDYLTGKLAGEYLNKYKKKTGLSIFDAIIAASCELNDLKIWTLNKKHYPMFKRKNFLDVSKY